MALFVHALPASTQRERTPSDAGDERVLWLDDLRALSAELTGAKAANLARAHSVGLPTIPGFAITTAATDGGSVEPAAEPAVRSAWCALTEDGAVPLVVRSSSTVEDTSSSSMAGQFASIIDVRGWPAFLEAIRTVLASASHPHDERTAPRPMAVLVQRLVDATCGGVLFGLDPLSGDHRVVVEVVPGSPDALVSGRVTAEHAVLGWRGRIVDGRGPDLEGLLDGSRRRRLHRLARAAHRAFGSPQDIEWAIDGADHLWLLQSRAVTATGGAARATGPVLGPGPVAETFPDPLWPLEVDLWVDPLRRGIAGALEITGAQPSRRIERSPVVAVVGGRVAADLELFRIVPPGGLVSRSLHPLRGVRRVVAAWRVGRLRAALPGLARDLTDRVDDDLAAVGDLGALDDHELVALLELAGQELVALHGHEVLAGMLLEESDRPSLTSAALGQLTACRSSGLDDEAAIARAPAVLALVPPAIGPTTLPASPLVLPRVVPALSSLGARDGLRLRCRWVQELSARAASELASRLAARGQLVSPQHVRGLHLGELRAALGGVLPADLDVRLAERPGAPLPVSFRLGPTQVAVAVTPAHAGRDGLPASSGRAAGTVSHDPSALAPGSVLVTGTLDPRLAASLPNLAALVAETGSALSHLAILARETRVPAVVGVADARRRFPPGSRVLVDGDRGEIDVIVEEVRDDRS